jgi:hypothetical protein
MSIFVLSVILKVDRLCPIIDLIFFYFRIWLFSYGLYFGLTPNLWTLAVTLCMAIGARPLVCVHFEMFILTPADGLCCVWLIYPAYCWFWCSEIGTTSVDWV